MNWNILIPLLITTIVAIIVWFIAHQLSMSRDIKNKRRELKVKYLIEAYRKLDNISHRGKFDPKDFESAIADIQLFGTKNQVNHAQKIAKEFANEGTTILDPLLEDLRRELRIELKLGKVPSKRVVLRIKEK